MNGDQRTNNYVEAWHSKFVKHIASHHPKIWKFLEKLKQEQRECDHKFVQILRGGHSRIRHPVRRLSQQQERYIAGAVADYEIYKREENVDGYLRSIAYRLKRPNV